MLPPSQRQSYEDFQQVLQHFHSYATTPDLEILTIQEYFEDVKRIFESKIASLNAEDIPPDNTSRWQSLQTEIYKQMRLLETDMRLLQAARSSATFQTRASGVCDRLNTLMQYCKALIQL
ncbi:MAG TPA: hypothetical protein DD379_22005 [Cyanobacteria bacterium UBA11162]|nr:hypothetical protein [Cyanobacteria bacterium UBA11162]